MRNTKQIEIARSQYSGATGRVTKGIGVVSLVYYNPDINKFWVIDYRQNLRYVIANMLKTLITQQCFIVKHFIISLNSWALYQT
ncbi:hypothetical protein [Rickettsia endosymbiont of Gonocerus acuteangulatus]|uniref:hypothetical protein n=1 Tax=Rickettsia endosymbiont of Gonocerus acuteangulatus TaxID=3066266 RepID=UPI0031331DA3